jgi:hypothetical protein
MNNLLLLKFTSVKVSLETYNHYSLIYIQTGAPVRSAASMLSGKSIETPEDVEVI